MNKSLLKLTLILLVAILMIALVACDPDVTPTPDGDDTTDTPSDDTPTPITFTVTFDSKGGTGIEGYTDIAFGQSVPAPSATPTKTGHIFDGWTLANGTPVDFDTYTVQSNVTFFASWKAKNYDITALLTDEGRKENIIDISTGSVSEHYGDAFAVNGGTLVQKDIDGISTWSTTFSLSYETTSASTQTLPVPTTTRTGDRFMYWYYYEGDTIVPLTATLAHGSQKKEVALLNGYKYDGARTIYAMWYSALDNITVKFNSGLEGIDLGIEDVVIKDGDHIMKPTAPAASGYDFNGWTYTLKDDEENDVVFDMIFYVDPSSHGTHITCDMATENVFNIDANWTKRIEITSASDWTSLDASSEDVRGANIYLMNDIELNDYTPIFDTSNPFSGIFDGNEHTIKIAFSSDTEGTYSLIGVNNGVIKRLTISESQIAVNTAKENNTIYAGFVTGISRGTITGVTINLSSVIIGDNESTWYVGGVVGANHGELSNISINSLGITTAGKNGNVGGIVGHNISGFIQGATVSDLDIACNLDEDGCVGLVAGKVTFGDTKKVVITNSNINLNAGGSGYAGGVAGLVSNNSIEECSISTCDIFVGKDTMGRNANAGGVVGEGGSAIKNTSLSAVSVEAIGEKIAVAGGVVGINFCEGGNRGQIQHTVATGKVSAKSAGKIYAGGISGQQNAGASSSTGAVAYVYAEFNVSATRLTAGEDATDVPVKIGKAFGSLDKSTTCKNTYIADTSTITVDEVEYNADDKQYEVTTHSAIQEITPGHETIQNATWIGRELKLDTNTWIVADGSYPTLKLSA